MTSAKEYNMLFKLQAQLGSEFTSSFAEAQRVLQQTRTKIQELNRQQADISAYQKQQTAVDNTARKLRDLQKEHDNIQREMQESESYSSSLENKLIEKQRAIENTTRALQNQTDKLNAQKAALQEAGFDTDHLTDESKKLTSQLDTLAQQEEEAAKEAEKYGNKGVAAFEAVGTALVASGIAAGIKAIYEAYGECVQIAGTFQETMSSVEALSGASAEEMNELSNEAKQLGATTKYTATEAAQAMTYMGMAGWDAQQMMSGMDGVLQLAAASGEDLALTSDIVTDSLTAFNLKAEDTAHFADVLAATATNSNTSVSIMGETFKQSASIAGALGYSIEDVSTAVGLMANAGVKGSIAGTALKNTFNGLLEGATLSSKALGEIEITAVKSDGTMKSFGETIKELRGYFSQMTEAERVNNAMAIAGQRGYNGLLAIVNSTDEDFQKLTNSIKDCNGAAADMAAVKMDNLNGQVTLMNSAMDALKTTVGEAFQDELKDLAKITTDVLTNVNEFLQANPAVLKGILLLGGALTTVVGIYTGYNTAKKVHNALKTLSIALTAKETEGEIEDTVATTAHSAALGGETTATTGATGATTAHTAALKASALQLGALIAVVTAVVAEFAYYADAIWGVSDAVKDVQGETQGIIDSMDESIAKSQAEMSMLQDKVEVYDELRLKENKTAEEQTRLANLAAELQDVFGDEVEVVNSLTGEYNDLSEAVDNYVAQKMRRAKMSAQEEAAEKAYIEIAEIERKMQERSEENTEYHKSFHILDWNGAVGTTQWMNDMKAYREEIAKCQKIIDDYEAALREEAGTTEESTEQTGKLAGASYALNQALMAVESGYLDVSAAAEQYGVGADQLNNAITSAKTYQSVLQNATATVRQGFMSAEEAAEQYGVTVENIDIYSNVETAITTIEALAHAYDEALEAAQKSVEGQYKLWDDAATIVAQDIDAINASLMSQTEYWQEYEANITKLTDKANDIAGLRELIATFADGSPESANMIAGMAQASDEDLQKMVDNWKSVQEEQSKTAEGLAELTTGAGERTEELKGTLDEIVENLDLEDEAGAAAKASIDAYIQALKDGEDEAVAAAERISSLVAAALNPGTAGVAPSAETQVSTNSPIVAQDPLAAAMSEYNALKGDYDVLQNMGYGATSEQVIDVVDKIGQKEAEIGKLIKEQATFVGPRLPAYASGTEGAAPGLALVGENGPELVVFDGGEQVIPAPETRAILNEMKDLYKLNAYANGTGDTAITNSSIYNNDSTQNVENNAVATANTSLETANISMQLANEVYYEILSFIPLINYISQSLMTMNAIQQYNTEQTEAAVAASYSTVNSREEIGDNQTVINVSPVFNVQGAGDDLEVRLREFSDELVEVVLDAIEESDMNARRRVYK